MEKGGGNWEDATVVSIFPTAYRMALPIKVKLLTLSQVEAKRNLSILYDIQGPFRLGTSWSRSPTRDTVPLKSIL
jgi:hypothetical protein